MLFSTFLTGMSNEIHTHVNDIMGVEIQAQIVEYDKQKIDYQYQIWKIKDQSVCARVKANNLNNYSACTTSAKDFFEATCSYLQVNPQQHWKYTKLKNMYCVAAANFKPTIAQISTPTKEETDIWEAKQKCSLLTLETRNTTSNTKAKERDAACAIARKMTTQ